MSFSFSHSRNAGEIQIENNERVSFVHSLFFTMEKLTQMKQWMTIHLRAEPSEWVSCVFSNYLRIVRNQWFIYRQPFTLEASLKSSWIYYFPVSFRPQFRSIVCESVKPKPITVTRKTEESRRVGATKTRHYAFDDDNCYQTMPISSDKFRM